MVINDIKRISKNSLGFTLGALLTQAVTFFLLPIYTRYLTPADYGIISLAAVLYSVLSILSFFGMRSAIGRYYYEYCNNPREFKEYISTLWIAIVFFGLILAIILTFTGGYLFPIIIPDVLFYPYILLVIWTVFLSIPLNLLLSLLQMKEDSFKYSILCVAQFITNTVTIILFVVNFREGALGSLKGQFIGTFVFFIVSLICLRKDLSLIFSRKKFIESLDIGLPLFPHELAGWVTTLLNRIFLSNYTTLTIVGLYTLGYQFGSLMSMFTSAINFAWVPYFMSTARNEGETAKPRFAGLVVYYQCFIFFIGLGIILFSSNVIRIMTTPSFYPSMYIIPFIVIGFLFDGFYYIWANNLVFAKKTRYLAFSTITGAIINIILSIFLIQQFGIYGAAYTMLFTYGYVSLLTFYFSQKSYHIYYNYIKMGKIIIAFGISLSPLLILPYYGFILDICIKTMLVGVYLAGLLIMGVITQEELNLGKKYFFEIVEKNFKKI